MALPIPNMLWNSLAGAEKERGFLSIRAWLVDSLAARAGVAATTIDGNERFKTLGLSSLDATALIAELGKLVGRPLSPTLAWEYPTPNALAQHLSEADGTGAASARIQDAEPADEPIAIVGLACRFPGAPDPTAYWALLRDG